MADEFVFGNVTKKELEDFYRKSFVQEYEGYFNSIIGYQYHNEKMRWDCYENASAIENEIVKIIGTVAGSNRGSIHINRNLGTAYVDNDCTIHEDNLQYPRLSELLRIFRINTAIELDFLDNINNIISCSLNNHIDSTYFRLKIEVAKELNTNLQSAENAIKKSGKRPHTRYSKNTTAKTIATQERLSEYEKLRKSLDKLLEEFGSIKNRKTENVRDYTEVFNDIISILVETNNKFKTDIKPTYADMAEYLGTDTANSIVYNACENVNATPKVLFGKLLGIPVPPKPSNHTEQKETHIYTPNVQMIRMNNKIPTYKKASKHDADDFFNEPKHTNKEKRNVKKIALITLAIIFFPITLIVGLCLLPIRAIKNSSSSEGAIAPALMWLGIAILLCGAVWGLSFLNIFEAGSDWMFSMPSRFGTWLFESGWYITVFNAFWALTLDNFFLIILLALPALVLILLLVVAELVLIVALIVFSLLMFVFGFVFTILPISIGILISTLATISFCKKDKDTKTTIVYILTLACALSFGILAML